MAVFMLVLARYSTLRTMEYFRVPRDLTLRANDVVVLKTRRGIELGQVKSAPGDPQLGPRDQIGGEVLRKPTIDDSNQFREHRAMDVKPYRRAFKELALKHKLAMRFENAERLLSADKVVVYFSSEDRVDFRDFVREYNEALNARVELRQVGARDAARLTGDVGVCGQELCCISYIIDFVPVSMKMAKTQRISLDPGKISGQCGRLKCCLKYEDDLYTELQKNVPLEGQPCKCEGHDCTACNVDILGQKVTVDFGDGKREIRDVKDITFDASWTEKDVRRYQKEVWAKREEERQKRLAAGERRARERTESRERRAKQQSEHPQRRVTDHRKTEGAAQVTAAPEPPPPADAAQLPSVPPPAPADERPVVSESGRLPPPDDPQPGPES